MRACVRLSIAGLGTEEAYRKFEETWREVTITRKLSHPNIVKYTTAFVVLHELWVVMPIMEGGSVREAMDSLYPGGIKDNAIVATILREITQGLQYLHENDLIHKDVKADNILLSEAGEVALADFGVCVSVSPYEQAEEQEDDSALDPEEEALRVSSDGDLSAPKAAVGHVFAGSPCWMAPEVIGATSSDEAGSKPATHKADMWSLGITALELAFGKPPYCNEEPAVIRQKISTEPPPNAKLYLDESYKFAKSLEKFVQSCLQTDPHKRLSTAKLLDSDKFLKLGKKGKVLADKLVAPMVEQRAGRQARREKDELEKVRLLKVAERKQIEVDRIQNSMMIDSTAGSDVAAEEEPWEQNRPDLRKSSSSAHPYGQSPAVVPATHSHVFSSLASALLPINLATGIYGQ